MVKETIEEAAEKYVKHFAPSVKSAREIGFIDGANYQAERMYREDEVVDLIADWTKMAKGLNINFPSDKFKIWFEQFKKK